MTVAYFALPIDQAGSNARLVAQEHEAQKLMCDLGFTVYRPSCAWSVGSDLNPVVETVNRFALVESDIVVALLPAGVPSIGVPREIELAIQNDIPVFVWTDVDSWSLTDVRVSPSRDALALALQSYASGAGSPEPSRDTTAPAGYVRPTAPHDVAGGQERTHDDGAILTALGVGGYPLSRAYPSEDAGFDLTISRSCSIRPGVTVDIPCDVQVDLPEGWWGLLVGRSSTLRARGLIVNTGIIDNGYQGELFVNVHNPGDQYVVVNAGERLAQLIPLPLFRGNIEMVHSTSEFRTKERGDKGFGSSGR